MKLPIGRSREDEAVEDFYRPATIRSVVQSDRSNVAREAFDLMERGLLLSEIQESPSSLHREPPQHQGPNLSITSLQANDTIVSAATDTEDTLQDAWMLLEELHRDRELNGVAKTIAHDGAQNIFPFRGDEKTSLLMESYFDDLLTILGEQIRRSQTGMMQAIKLADDKCDTEAGQKMSSNMVSTYNTENENFAIPVNILDMLSAKFVMETQLPITKDSDQTLPSSLSNITLLVQDVPLPFTHEVPSSEIQLSNTRDEKPHPLNQQHLLDGEMLLVKIREASNRASSQQLENPSNPAFERDETLVDSWRLLEEKHRLARADGSSTMTGDGHVEKFELLRQTPYDELIAHLADKIHKCHRDMRTMTGTDGKGIPMTTNNLDDIKIATPFDDVVELLKMKFEMDKGGNIDPPQPLESEGRDSSHLRRDNPLPGAFRIDGIDYNPGMDNGTISHDDNTNTQSLPLNDSGNDLVVEADILNEANIMLAKLDPWWRRHQWWVAGAGVLVIVGIVLVVTLTTIDLQGTAPTMSPTSLFAGTLFDIQALITTSLPGANNALEDDTTPQYTAFRWLGDVSFSEPEAYSNSSRILQQFALASLFFSTNGATSWMRTDGWLNNTDECKWYGVRCRAGESLIFALSLSDNGINGTIPSDLAILSNSLTEMNFSKNRLLGSIPSELGLLSALTSMMLNKNMLSRRIPFSVGKLTSLEFLDLSENTLASSLPTEVGKMISITHFNTKDNNLIGPIPSELGLLTKLTNLDFQANELSFAIPSELGGLSNLRTMNLQNNSFNRPIPSELGLIGQLVTLDLSSNLLFSTVPNEIGLLASLIFFDISKNMFTGTFPDIIESLSNLSWLSLGDNLFQGSIPYWLPFVLKDSITHMDLSLNEFSATLNEIAIGDLHGIDIYAMTKLVSIELYRDTVVGTHSISGTLQPEISDLTDLRVFDVSSCQISGTVPTEIRRLSNLVVFNVPSTRLSGRIPTEIGLVRELEILDFASMYVVSSTPTEIGRLARLALISFEFTSLEGPIISELMSLTYLTSLDLTNSGVTGTLPNEISLLTKLTNLDLTSTNLSGTIPSSLASLVSLERLSIGGGHTGSVPSEIWFFSNLRFLDFDLGLYGSDLSTTFPTEVGLMRHLTGLRIIDLNLEGSSIPSFIGALRSLKILDLQSTNISGTLPTQMGLLTDLQEMSLKGNSLRGSLPSSLGNCRDLQILDLEGNHLTGSVPSEIGMAISLTSIILRNTSVTGSLPTELGLLSRLDSLFFLVYPRETRALTFYVTRFCALGSCRLQPLG